MTSSIVHLERTLRVTLPASVITNRSRSVIAFLTSSLIRMVMTVVETESIQTHSFRPNTFIPLAHRQLLSPASPKLSQSKPMLNWYGSTGEGGLPYSYWNRSWDLRKPWEIWAGICSMTDENIRECLKMLVFARRRLYAPKIQKPPGSNPDYKPVR